MINPNSRIEKILFLVYYEHQSVPSIKEGVEFVKSHSQFQVFILNLAEHRFDNGFLKIPPTIDLHQFHAIIIHNTIAYSVDNLRSLDQVTNTKLKSFHGVKIIMKQDEHYRFKEFISYASEINVDYIFSVMPQEEIKNTYGLYSLGARIVPMMTGYVMPSMRVKEPQWLDRPIDVGYRGSIMPLSFGRLCYQKRKIGDEIVKRLSNKNLRLDISSLWEDRIGGVAWFDFLGSCKAVLGVESGTGLFDLDGTLEDKCREIEKNLGVDDGSDEYAEKYLTALKDKDGAIKYYTISPRHFEAIACGAVQILMPGKYSGKMIAGHHYVELAEDYSNLTEVMDFVLDESKRISMARKAYYEVINNKENWIESFVNSLDDAISNGLISKGVCAKPLVSSQSELKNILIIQAHHFGADPRRDYWYSSAEPEGVKFHQLGIRYDIKNNSYFYGDRDQLIIDVPKLRWNSEVMAGFLPLCSEDVASSHVLRELFFLANCLDLTDRELFEIYKIPINELCMSRFKWYLNYLLDTCYTLIMTATKMKGVHAIVAINFPSLPAAIVIKSLLGISLVYEALEYWPEADPDQTEAENLFWMEIEKRIVCYADYRGTVSPGLARLMSEKYNVDFYSVPNYVPLKSPQNSIRSLSNDCKFKKNQHKTYFLYQGTYAKGRAIDTLINAWVHVDERAILLLRGPDNLYKQELEGLVERLNVNSMFPRVIFLDEIDPDALIWGAAQIADVGVIPYFSNGANYEHCSPNKLGQYLAAALPILANNTSFVEKVINQFKCGLVENFSNQKKLNEAIKKLCDKEFRRECSKNSLRSFKFNLNWESVSTPFYKSVLACVDNKKREKLSLFAIGISYIKTHEQDKVSHEYSLMRKIKKHLK